MADECLVDKQAQLVLDPLLNSPSWLWLTTSMIFRLLAVLPLLFNLLDQSS